MRAFQEECPLKLFLEASLPQPGFGLSPFSPPLGLNFQLLPPSQGRSYQYSTLVIFPVAVSLYSVASRERRARKKL